MKRLVLLLLVLCMLMSCMVAGCAEEKPPVDSQITDPSTEVTGETGGSTGTEASDPTNASGADQPSSTPTEPSTVPTEPPTVPTTPAAYITLSAFAGKTEDVLHPTIRSYIDQRKDAKALAEMLKAEKSQKLALIRQNITFSWSATGTSGPYTLSVADNVDFKNAFTLQVTGTSSADLGFFQPGITYYWKVADGSGLESEVDTFTVKDAPSRLISAGSMLNVRDMGGWSAGSGKRIAYGKLYRGDDPAENANALSFAVFSYLGIQGEIDLRFDSAIKKNQFGDGKPFLNAGILYFYQVVPGEYAYTKEQTDNIGKIFKFLSKEENYPVYIHCSWGKDRTGTIGYLIGGLLGMSYEDLMCDYELSSYGKNIDSQPRNEIVADPAGGWQFQDAADDPWGAVGRLHYVLQQKYPADSISGSIEKYLIQECGVTAAEIAKVKEILLEDA